MIRGLIFKRDAQPAGGSLHPTSDHDLLRSGWPSMLENLVMPARLCGFDVHIHVIMHPNSRARLDDEYMQRLRAIDSGASIWTVPADTPDSQFDVPRAFLQQQFDASAYQLVVMTRDDFVYRQGSWDALSSRYDPRKLNIVSTDCSGHVWDGLHVFPASQAAVFARAWSGRWAHDLVSRIDLEETGVLHVWFTGMYGQPDECEPAMGYLDRGAHSIGNRFPVLFEQNQYSAAWDGGHCCASAHQELESMRGLHSCPILSLLPPALPEPPFPPAPPKPPPRIPSSYVLPTSTYRCCGGHELCQDEYMRPDDPHHPDCTPPTEPRFALVLHGMVSKLSGKTITWDSDEDYNSTNFVDPVPVYQHYVRFLMEPSGGVSNFDVFMHTATPSQQVQHTLASLFQPIKANFTTRYHSEWKPRVDLIRQSARAASVEVDEPTASRWLSAVTALNLVKEAEETGGFRYDKIYLTRPDVLLWAQVDLRRYCNDAVYYSNCHPPYFPGRTDGCPSDFHYVMSSVSARRMASIIPFLRQYRNTGNMMHNSAMGDFVHEVIGIDFRTDHIVIARHEEVYRKTQDMMMEANFYKCHPSQGVAQHG